MMRIPLETLCGFLLATLALRGAETGLQVKIQAGIVEGKTEGDIRAFLGIPYAAPPVGDLRWKPPVPVAHWNGVRKATEFGPRPMQPTVYKDMVFRDPGCSEDCLSLNVWTPARNSEARLPVMVWIFGGGYLAGGTSEQRQDGVHLADRGVVVVSMNYRLGLFGFFVHPELIRESPDHAAGNYGLMDQLAAIRWVHDNIAGFGGDPANITIFGESAGSFSVSAQMASPLARGLFQKAIGESGAAFFSRGLPQEPLEARAQKDAESVARRVGARTLAELRAMPAQVLLDAVTKSSALGAPGFGLDVDGNFLPEPAASIFSEGKQNDVPLLVGWNRDEAGVSLPTKTPAVERMKKIAGDEFGNDAGEFLRLYPSDTEQSAARSGAEFAGDRFIAFSTWAWAEMQAKTGRQPVFQYRFDRAPPTDFLGRKHGAFHSAEIVYVFGAFDAQPQVPWTPADREVSDLIQSYWTNFARTGDPNGPGLPNWPAHSSSSGWQVMHLDSPSAARPDEFRDRYLFLAREWGK
jgi:para-nitrobenzyl esterase